MKSSKIDSITLPSFFSVIDQRHNPTTTACALNRKLNWKAKRTGIRTFFLVIFYIV